VISSQSVKRNLAKILSGMAVGDGPRTDVIDKMMDRITKEGSERGDVWRPNGSGGFFTLHLASFQSEERRRILRRDGFVTALSLAVLKTGVRVSPFPLVAIMGDRNSLTDLDLVRQVLGEDDHVYRQLELLPVTRPRTIPNETVQLLSELMLEAMPNEMVSPSTVTSPIPLTLHAISHPGSKPVRATKSIRASGVEFMNMPSFKQSWIPTAATLIFALSKKGSTSRCQTTTLSLT
jgi:hypothetical protein